MSKKLSPEEKAQRAEERRELLKAYRAIRELENRAREKGALIEDHKTENYDSRKNKRTDEGTDLSPALPG